MLLAKVEELLRVVFEAFVVELATTVVWDTEELLAKVVVPSTAFVLEPN